MNLNGASSIAFCNAEKNAAPAAINAPSSIDISYHPDSEATITPIPACSPVLAALIKETLKASDNTIS